MNVNNNHLLKGCIQIARPDYWFKNVFVLPGIFFASTLTGFHWESIFSNALIAILVASLIASSNYIINEFFDAEYDRKHPLKSKRPFARGDFPVWLAVVEYLLFLGAGLIIALNISPLFFLTCVIFSLSGIAYNIPPLRLKDHTYFDVLSESFNIVIRLLLGWSIILPTELPPVSIVLAFWSAGAFIMTVKRLAEYRFLGQHETAVNYRSSFAGYTENKLIVTCLFYSNLAALFIGIFLIKYQIGFIFVFPLLALYFAWYMLIGLKDSSIAQTPEKLFRERKFVVFTLVLVGCIVAFSLLQFEIIEGLKYPYFIKLNLNFGSGF